MDLVPVKREVVVGISTRSGFLKINVDAAHKRLDEQISFVTE